MGLLRKEDWQQASWIGYEELPDSQRIVPAAHGNGEKAWGKRPDVLPLLRKEFPIQKRVKSATMFISGLGQFELFVNGKKAGDHFLDPGWTNYDRYALYVSFDVASLLQAGNNAVGVMLGNGFYYVPGERYRKLTGGFGYPKMICRLVVEYTDGTTSGIVSDESWKTIAGPVHFSSIYGGESYDANLDQEGWLHNGFDDSKWKQAVQVDAIPVLQSQTTAPIRLTDTLSPVKTTMLSTGTYVFDMGQNASAIPYIKVKGNKGDTVKIIPGELLDSYGHVSQRSSGGPFYFSYILKGDGIETWHPQFSYYGYRYLQVENISMAGKESSPGTPVLLAVQSLHMHADFPETGSFSCSNQLFNQTAKLIDWAIRSNMQSVFTDCPHRERLGWQEQLHLMGPSFHVNYDISSFGNKLMSDIKAAQQGNGLIPSTVPEYTEMHFANGYFRDSPEWGSTGIIMPWNMYKWYGDKKLLTDFYPEMKKYLHYLDERDSSNLLMYGLSDWYDIGPQRSGFCQLTPMGLTATAIYYYDLNIMSKVATMLGKKADAMAFASKAALVKEAFNKAYYHADTKQYGTGSQTSNAMALYMDMVEPSSKSNVIDNILDELKTGNYKLTAGDIGYRYLLRVLETSGNNNVIFKMNNRSDVPGYGYQIAKGATALTEAWDASPLVSNNHFMLGHILEWFYSGLAGIRQQDDAVAYDKIVIVPAFETDISHVNASFHSPYGAITSKWVKQGNGLKLDVSIPVNATAKICLPYKTNAAIQLNGKAISTVTSDIQKDKLYVHIGSGNYQFIIHNALK
jgi:alpha-L-rhamnosidase